MGFFLFQSSCWSRTYCSFTWFLMKIDASFHWNLISKLADADELECLMYTILLSACLWLFQWSFWLGRQTGGSRQTKMHCLPFSCLCFFHIVINHSTGLEPRVGNWNSVGSASCCFLTCDLQQISWDLTCEKNCVGHLCVCVTKMGTPCGRFYLHSKVLSFLWGCL